MQESKHKKSLSVIDICTSFSFLRSCCPVIQRQDPGKWGSDELGGVGLRISERKEQFYSRDMTMNSMSVTRGGPKKRTGNQKGKKGR